MQLYLQVNLVEGKEKITLPIAISVCDVVARAKHLRFGGVVSIELNLVQSTRQEENKLILTG